MKSHQPKPIQFVITETLQQLGLGTKVRQYEIFEQWPAIVGEQIAKSARPERIERGKLFVRVMQSTWRNELVFLKKEIIAKINKTMNQEIIKDIIFR